jgi:hypothetical protein
MRLCNYTSILKWYVVEKDSGISYGQLLFCQEIQSSSIIRLFDNENDLANYLNNFHNEIDWYKKNKLEFLPLKYSEKMLNNLIQSGPPTRYGWRVAMDDDTSNKLNVLLLGSPSKDSSKPDPIINLIDSGGTLRNIPLLDFIPLVFEYQQTRPLFMNVIKQLRESLTNITNP